MNNPRNALSSSVLKRDEMIEKKMKILTEKYPYIRF